MRNDECTLITRKAIGENIADKETRVFCEKKSVVRSEYYAAYAVGLRPRLTLSIYQPDYELSFVVNDDGTIEEPTQGAAYAALGKIYVYTERTKHRKMMKWN